ncbi:MAG: hypothetical protein HKP41_19735 [Desulfobacterales bacterium]|nr:hypothetical protein [Desulfobacterales bacterium]
MASKTETRLGLLLLTLVLISLAVFFLFQTLSSSTITSSQGQLNPEWYTLTTARGNELDNKSIVGNCHLCHAYWVPIPTSEQTRNPRFAHANIQLKHGTNDRCYNCHQISDRNQYVANDGSSIMVQIPEKLCERCHGLIYKDWLAGTHGKWTGKWQPETPRERRTYTCTQCHDPHNPAFKYMTIAPPPVWHDKFIRTEAEGVHDGPLSNFLIDDEPKEIF